MTRIKKHPLPFGGKRVIDKVAYNQAIKLGLSPISLHDFLYNSRDGHIFCQVAEEWMLVKYIGLVGTPKDQREGYTFTIDAKGTNKMVKFTNNTFGNEWLAVKTPSRNWKGRLIIEELSEN